VAVSRSLPSGRHISPSGLPALQCPIHRQVQLPGIALQKSMYNDRRFTRRLVHLVHPIRPSQQNHSGGPAVADPRSHPQPTIAIVLILITVLLSATPASTRDVASPPEPSPRLIAQIREPGTMLSEPKVAPQTTYQAQALEYWVINRPPSNGGRTNTNTALAVDSAGHPHLVYWEQTSEYDVLFHAWHDGDMWWREDIATGPDVGQWASIQIDARDDLHVAYSGGIDRNLHYAHYDDSNGWKTEVVDADGSVGSFCSLALDASGRPHIAYQDTEKVGLKFASHNGIEWQVAEVDNSCLPQDISLALDVHGNPYISYVDTNSSDLKVASHQGSAWIVETVRSEGSVGWGSSVVVDNNNHPHISHYNLSNQTVEYTTYDGTSWDTDTVGTTGIVNRGQYTSLVLGRDLRPRVAYYIDTGTDSSMMHAEYGDTGWVRSQIDPEGLALGGCTLAVDVQNRSHVVYTRLHDVFVSVTYAVRPTVLPEWSGLSFASFRDMNFEIYTAASDGSDHTRRTFDPATDTTPALRPGVGEVAFVSYRTGAPGIYKADLTSGSVTLLALSATGDYLPDWSPDGDQVAFFSYRDGNGEIYVVNADGTGLARLTSHPAWDGHPAWSPDGTQMAFVSDRTGTYELWIMNAEGSGAHQISYGLGTAAYPDWSPDGTRLVYNYDAGGNGWFSVGLIRTDGSGSAELLTGPPGYQDYLAPVWSPTGHDIAFSNVRWQQYDGRWYWTEADIVRLDLDLYYHPIVQITDSGYAWWPDWQTSDATPPASQAVSPQWTDQITFTVQWSGDDSGGSLLRSYDVQYRNTALGTWTDWLTDTLRTQSAFTGELKHTYD
jgi:Tol biopolymer transport system component